MPGQDRQTTAATEALVGTLQDPLAGTGGRVKSNALQALKQLLGFDMGADLDAAEPLGADVPLDPNDPVNNERFGDTRRTADPRKVRTFDLGLQ